MDCQSVFFSGHAIRRMFERKISRDEVHWVIHNGEAIAEYPDDQPYPSRLMLEFVNSRALHVVVSVDDTTGSCYVITAYDPDPELWESDFRERKSS